MLCGLEAIVGLSELLEHQVATAFDVKRVEVLFGLGVGLLDVVERVKDLALLEGAPGEVLVHFVVVGVVRLGNLVGALSLLEFALKLVQNTDFKLGVDPALHREVGGEDRVLEVSD